MKTFNYLAAATLMLASAAASATVWTPTNEDTDFFQFNFTGLSTNGGTLALFDDEDTGFAGDSLIIGSNGGQVKFISSGSDWTAELYIGNALVDSMTLTSSTQFILGMDWNNTGYVSDSSWVQDPAINDTYNIAFTGSVNGQEIVGNTTAIDVQPVPVPAAAWLFGSGLIGLVGIARRRA